MSKLSLQKNLFIIIGITLGLFLMIWGIYYLIFVHPIATSRKSLTASKNLVVGMKLVNSQNLLGVKELISINPSHPEYKTLIEGALTKISGSSEDFKKIQAEYSSMSFGGTKDVKNYLKNEYSKKFGDILNTYSKNLAKTSSEIENFEKVSSTLANVISYNPYADLSGIDLNNDLERENAVKKSESASNGLKKALNDLGLINSENKKTLEANLIISINLLSEFSKAVSAGDIKTATEKRQAFMDSYRDVKQTSEEIFRSALDNETIENSTNDQENMTKELDMLVNKIEEFQKNLQPK